MYTLYKFHFLNGISEINQLFDDILIIWPAPVYIYVTLEHKSSLKSLGYIYSNSQKYIVWVKITDFSFMPKIIRILSKDHVP